MIDSQFPSPFGEESGAIPLATALSPKGEGARVSAFLPRPGFCAGFPVLSSQIPAAISRLRLAEEHALLAHVQNELGAIRQKVADPFGDLLEYARFRVGRDVHVL